MLKVQFKSRIADMGSEMRNKRTYFLPEKVEKAIQKKSLQKKNIILSMSENQESFL